MDEMIEILEKQEWIFAKTYAKTTPHEYCLKERAKDKDEYVKVCRYILEKGFTAKWYGHPNKYIYANGYMYWTMHPVAEEVILINRSKADDYEYNICHKRKEKPNVNNLQGN